MAHCITLSEEDIEKFVSELRFEKLPEFSIEVVGGVVFGTPYKYYQVQNQQQEIVHRCDTLGEAMTYINDQGGVLKMEIDTTVPLPTITMTARR